MYSYSCTVCFMLMQSSATDTEFWLGGVKLESCASNWRIKSINIHFILFRKSSSNTQLDPFYKSSLRWKQLYYSFHIGNSSKNEKACFQKFLTCTFDLPQFINVPVLHLWQLASNFIDIRLDDN